MAQIKVNGELYDLPESFTLKEMRVIERYAGGHLADDGYEVSKMAGAIHVAIARAKPELTFEDIEAAVDLIDAADLETLAGQSPPEETASKSSEPNGSSNGASELASDASQGNGTPESSGAPALPTGFTSFHETSKT